jgi:putative ABC transport system ATP-binding protein
MVKAGQASVRLNHVSKRYGSAEHGVAALDDVSLEVRAGELVAIMGPSGCGKSTLLNLIAGIDTPTAGQVLLDGQDLAMMSDDVRSDLRLRSVGFVFQAFYLLPTFSAIENVMVPLEFLGVAQREARRRAARVLDEVAIPASAHERRPAALSGGEQQRAAIARALVAEPALLLADEPTGNLDSRTGEQILALLVALNQSRALAVVMATHSEMAAGHAGRVVELRDGRVAGMR